MMEVVDRICVMQRLCRQISANWNFRIIQRGLMSCIMSNIWEAHIVMETQTP